MQKRTILLIYRSDALGFVDLFGWTQAFGPARLRLSLSLKFAKEIMVKYSVPTAYGIFQISRS